MAADKETLSLYLPVAIRNILQGSSRRDTFNVLSVGCGNGKIDQLVVEIIHRELKRNEKFKNTKIFNCAIDPNGRSIHLYRQNIDRSLVCGETIFDVRQLSWEEYKQERSLKKDPQNCTMFDIVHFMHSLYFLDIQETLDHCIERELTENGQIICLVSDYITNTFLSRLRPNTLKQYGKATADDCYKEIIKKFATERGWNVEHYTQERFIDVTESFQAGSVKGNLLLDFLTKTKNFRGTADKEKVEEILQVIQEKSTEKDGKVLSLQVEDLLFIYK